MSASLSIKLKRANKVYHEGETVAGVVAVSSAGELRHEGLTLALEGGVTLQAGARSAGLLDALGGGGKPLPLVSASLELAVGGRLPAGVTEIPFELPLRARPGAPPLLETYHGVFVNVVYALRCSMRRSFLNKPLADSCQIFVQQQPRESAVARPVRCEITPGSVRAGGGARHNMPHFQIYVELHSTVCALDRPVTGQIRVEECSVPIKSIELQLVRVETCGSADGYTRDATEIQNIQVGAGDVCRARAVPLYMLLPRLFTCPTTTTPHFKIEFELNIAVIFEDDYLVTENFPILLLRSR